VSEHLTRLLVSSLVLLPFGPAAGRHPARFAGITDIRAFTVRFTRRRFAADAPQGNHWPHCVLNTLSADGCLDFCA